MTVKGVVRQVEGTLLVASGEEGQSVVLHAPKEGETRRGLGPMELFLLAAGGCTAMDVIETLEKMRQDVTQVEIELEGDRAEEPPRVYTHLRLVYRVRGRGIQRDRVERAVELSQTRYCSVIIALRRSGAEVETEVQVEDD